MKVKMTARLDGEWHEDGEWRSYPAPGEVLETSDVHGADLCAQGYAKPVAEERKAETRPAPDAAEKRAAPPNVNAPKGDWVAFAVSKGVPLADADAMTKQDLIGHYGS